MQMLPDVLVAEDVSRVMRVSLSSAYKVMNRGDFPLLDCGIRRKLVRREAFLEWLVSKAKTKLVEGGDYKCQGKQKSAVGGPFAEKN